MSRIRFIDTRFKGTCYCRRREFHMRVVKSETKPEEAGEFALNLR